MAVNTVKVGSSAAEHWYAEVEYSTASETVFVTVGDGPENEMSVEFTRDELREFAEAALKAAGRAPGTAAPLPPASGEN